MTWRQQVILFARVGLLDGLGLLLIEAGAVLVATYVILVCWDTPNAAAWQIPATGLAAILLGIPFLLHERREDRKIEEDIRRAEKEFKR